MATKVFVYLLAALISAFRPATSQVAAQPTAGDQVQVAEHSNDGPRNINAIVPGPAGPTDAAHLGTTMANLTTTEIAPTTVSGDPPASAPAAPVEHHPALQQHLPPWIRVLPLATRTGGREVPHTSRRTPPQDTRARLLRPPVLSSHPQMATAEPANPAAPETPNTSTTAVGHPQANNTSVAAGHPSAMNITAAAPNATAHPPVHLDLPESVNASSAPGHALEQGHSPQEPLLESPPTTTCYPKTLKHLHRIYKHHCHKISPFCRALDQIVFAPNGPSTTFHAAFSKKETLDVIVHGLAIVCHSKGGIWASSKMTVEVKRGQEEVYEVDRPTCKKEECPQTVGDCLSLIRQPFGYEVPSTNSPRTVSPASWCPGKTEIVHVSARNCTVSDDDSVSSTDTDFVNPMSIHLFESCLPPDRSPPPLPISEPTAARPGRIFFAGGTKGFNGDVRLSVAPVNYDLCR
ncbi:hypothetical protein VP01_2250g3 [Puccinia sorghi]|uniref:Uncharacterized protein n=1 Tax=Puccinia sorghi TaxID=27349 RepID=A0A0L6V8E0_9BASI|nr:hypothetical protein VP01_2250g3 [Puccinia sorghi]